MKRIVYFLFIFNLLFIAPKIYAKEYLSSEISSSSYVVGEHLFTRDINDEYLGQLTTNYIMLASKTINDQNFIIYYKNPRGVWYDALTGNKIQNIPSSFNINFVNGKLIDQYTYEDYTPNNVVKYKDDDISPSSYVIGTHVFTRNINSNYIGQLTTNYIMIASKTINKNNISDMKIYYKNPRGIWYNALTGNKTDIPSEFEIEYKDLEYIGTFLPTDINEAEIELSEYSYEYSGNAIKPTVTINFNNNILKENIDYELSFKDNVNSGEAKLIIKGIGNYRGEKEIIFNINKKILNEVTNDYCKKTIYNSENQIITLNAPNEILFTNNIFKNAGSYLVKVSIEDKRNYIWENGTNLDYNISCKIDKKDVTITAKNQEIKYNNSIINNVSMVTTSGLAKNDKVSQVNLSTNNYIPTKEGEIIINSAKIIDNEGIDVTQNYEVTYISGELIINPDDTIVINNFDEFKSSISTEDLSDYGVEYPNLSYVSTEVEENRGLLATFNEVQGYGWAQRYIIDSNLSNNFKMINEFKNDYNIRIWITEETGNKFALALYLYDEMKEFYIEPSKIKLVDESGYEVEKKTDYTNYEFYEKTHILLPKKFRGWVNFPISAIKNDSGDTINLKSLNKIIIDIRPETPNKNTFYIMDNLTLSKKSYETEYNKTYEISYRNDLVGIKYSNWFDYWYSPAGNNGNIYNISNIINGFESYGPQNSFHYWGKPALGYYRSSDSDVIRTHMQQLSDAYVDFIFVDLTNLSDKNINITSNLTNEEWYSWYETYIWPYQVKISIDSILDTMNEMKNEGINIPHIVFWAASFNKFGTYDDIGNQYVINRLYDEYINNAKYKDLFVYYNGKPLVIGTNNIPESQIQKDITYRYMWALQTSQTEINNGEWTNRILPGEKICGVDLVGNIEEMPINVAYSAYYMSLGATNPALDGRYYHSWDLNTPVVIGRENGKTFYNSWQAAFDVHPKILMISSWNEWGAQRITNNDALCKDKCFTDQYNEVYSEDIEPMEGGHGDQYYKWMKQYISDYKSYKNCPKLYNN